MVSRQQIREQQRQKEKAVRKEVREKGKPTHERIYDLERAVNFAFKILEDHELRLPPKEVRTKEGVIIP